MGCPCDENARLFKKHGFKEISTSNRVESDFLPITGLDMTEKIDVNYLDTNSTRMPNDELERVDGEPYPAEPYDAHKDYQYGDEPPHEPYLSEYYPEQQLNIANQLQLQEAQVFDENDRQRGADGRWVKGAGSSDGGEEEFSQSKDTESYSENLSRRKEKFKNEYKKYAAYDENADSVKAPNQIYDTPQPNEQHYATAYNILQLYPELDEEETIKNAWLIDKERAKHEARHPQLMAQMQQAVAGMDGVSVKGRVKTRFKALEKMGRKQKYKTPADMGDMSGYMIIAPTVTDQAEANKRLHKFIQTDPKKLEDTVNPPRPDGYRAIHEEIIFPDGTKGELQLKTPNQAKIAEYMHDNTYKPDPNTETGKLIIDNMATFQEYNIQMSDYLYQIDRGNKKAIPPVCPKIIRSSIGCLE